jgi:hypothetical protein
MAVMANFLKSGGAVVVALMALIGLGGLALGAVAQAAPAAGLSPAPSRPGGPGGSACGIPSFAPPVTYTVALRPRSATVATLNADAHPDIVVTNYSANAISVLIGNGDGTFQPSVTYPAGVHPVAVAVGDFNEDTKPDLIVSNYDSANVSLLLGNGDGTFQGTANFGSGIGPYGVTVGDFNEDTHVDVAVSNVNFGNLNVMLGNGNGTLQGPVAYAAGLRPQVIATADFNSDSHLDLVVPNYTAATVSVLAGTGTGTFQAAVPYPVEDGPDYLTVADVNTDTHPDLLIPHYATGNVSVLLGNGSGSFLPEALYPAGGANPLFVAVADFDGDGVLDLATANYGSDTVAILRGNGDGTFQAALTFPVGVGTSPVAVGGGLFDADARLDLFAANENTNDVSIFISTCGLTTPTPTPPPSATPSPTAGCGDGWHQVASPNDGARNNSLAAVAVVAANDVWAVGWHVDGVGIHQSLAQHWDGNAWTIIPSFAPAVTNNWLNGVAAVAANDVWAVGYMAPGGQEQALILHWDGVVWSQVPTPPLVGSSALTGVVAIAANDVWAVGSVEDATLTLHWNGTAWAVVPSPNAAAGRSFLMAVAAVSADDLWAVGASYDVGVAVHTLTLHWEGTQWSIVASPNVADLYNELNAVTALASNDVWAVGPVRPSAPNYFSVLVLHWDGSTWTPQIPPHYGLEDNTPYGVAAISANDVWVVGTYVNNNMSQPLTLHWSNNQWTLANSPSGGNHYNYLYGVASQAVNDIWAVGFENQSNGAPYRTLTEHYTGACGTPTPGPSATPTSTVPAPTGTAPPPTSTPPTSTPTPSATPTTCAIPFNDVPQGSTFYDYIETLACRGIVSGYPCGGPGEPCPGQYFRPNTTVTGGQVSKIVSESAAFSDPVPSTQQTFEDVAPGSTFWVWIERLAGRGIIGGYPCGGPFEPCLAPANRPYFRPNNNVTRGQLSKITSGAAGWTETPTGQTFEDAPPGSTFYLWIERMAARGIIGGYPCGGPFEPCVAPGNRPYFRPNNNATRGQMSKIATLAFFPALARPPAR